LEFLATPSGNFRDKIKKVWDCDNKLSTELPPCEYYCSYEFAFKFLDIRNGKTKVENSKFYGSDAQWAGDIKIDEITGFLSNLDEERLYRSIVDAPKRPEIKLDSYRKVRQSIKDGVYRSAVYCEFQKRGTLESTRNNLLKDLLYFYGRDASGDGGVNEIQEALYHIQSRLSKNK